MDIFINQELKLRERKWLDTIVVLTVNDVGRGLEEVGNNKWEVNMIE